MTRAADVVPTNDDDLVAESSEVAGGRFGRRGEPGTMWWTPLRVSLVLCFLVFSAGVFLRAPCAADGFLNDNDYVKQCYTDIGVLYSTRGLDEAIFPYAERPESGGETVEYPVLQGLLMWVPSLLIDDGLDEADAVRRYYAFTAVILFMLALVTVWATWKTARGRPWDATIVAAAPSVALVGTLNWDYLPIALLALAILAWSREHPWLAGVLIGLGGAAKLYPFLVLGPLLILCWRAGALRPFARTAVAAAGTWAVVNLPIALAYPEGWARFYDLSRDRPFDFGSIWIALEFLGLGQTWAPANTLATGSFLLLCGAIAFLGVTAPRRPRFAQLAFLVVAAFLLTNKVYSPQYALWLLPLAALARPRWRDILIWQGGQAVYYVGVWLWLNKFADANRALSDNGYAMIILIHVASTLWLCAMVVRDVLRPEHDPIRTTPDLDGEPMDDPTGGVLDRRPDRDGFPFVPGLWDRAARDDDEDPAEAEKDEPELVDVAARLGGPVVHGDGKAPKDTDKPSQDDA